MRNRESVYVEGNEVKIITDVKLGQMPETTDVPRIVIDKDNPARDIFIPRSTMESGTVDVDQVIAADGHHLVLRYRPSTHVDENEP